MVVATASTGSKKGTLWGHLMSFLLGIICSHLLLRPAATLSSAHGECPKIPSTTASAASSSIAVKDEGEATAVNSSRPTKSSTVGPSASSNFGTEEKSFYDVAIKKRTDKVLGVEMLPKCLENEKVCIRPGCVREECRPWGHWYHTLYQQRIAKYSMESTEPFQFLEIGFYNGQGYDTYREFFSKSAEVHSMEISCLPEGPLTEGKWPWGNPAKTNTNYQKYLDEDRLHCGDASNQEFLNKIWTSKMHRPDAPPLKIVVDDGAHVSNHMIQSVFFWFPRIEPGGLLVVEDIQPIYDANKFRTQFLPQIMSDLHFCGDPKEKDDSPCFPLLQKLLHSIHCEMHICIFERNQKPAIPDLPLTDSIVPDSAFDASLCPSIKGGGWGRIK